MRITLLRALYLGDFLAAVPAYRGVRRAFPGARIVLAAPATLAPLVTLLDGAIDELAPTAEYAAIDVAGQDADLGVNLHGCGPASHHRLLAGRARRLIAYRHADVAASHDGPAFDAGEHEVARWCRLLAAFGIACDPDALDLRRPPIRIPARLHDATVLHPGASSEARRWPPARWSEVARAERRAGRRVIVTGTADEAERAHAIARAAGIPPRDVIAGRTSLAQLAAIVAVAGRVVCGDTGVAHLASAYRRPSVLLFGPTPPSRWGPPPRPYHRVLWNGTTGDQHATTVDPGLAAITVAQVLGELQALPSNAPAA